MEHPVSGMAREKQEITPAKLLCFPVSEAKQCFSEKNQNPFVPILVVPFSFGRLLPAGHDPFYPKAGRAGKELLEVFRKCGVVWYAVQGKQIVHAGDLDCWQKNGLSRLCMVMPGEFAG